MYILDYINVKRLTCKQQITKTTELLSKDEDLNSSPSKVNPYLAGGSVVGGGVASYTFVKCWRRNSNNATSDLNTFSHTMTKKPESSESLDEYWKRYDKEREEREKQYKKDREEEERKYAKKREEEREEKEKKDKIAAKLQKEIYSILVSQGTNIDNQLSELKNKKEYACCYSNFDHCFTMAQIELKGNQDLLEMYKNSSIINGISKHVDLLEDNIMKLNTQLQNETDQDQIEECEKFIKEHTESLKQIKQRKTEYEETIKQLEKKLNIHK